MLSLYWSTCIFVGARMACLRHAALLKSMSFGKPKSMSLVGSVMRSSPCRDISGLAPSPIASTNLANSGSSALQRGWRSGWIWKKCRRGDDLMHASIICCLLPPHIMGHVCWKSLRKERFYHWMANHFPWLVNRFLQHRLKQPDFP